MNCNVLTALNC